MRLILTAVFHFLIVLSDSQLVTYDINTQSVCSEVQEGARNDCRWPAGLNLMIDKIVDGGLIIAYKIEWYNGNWSQWYIPRVNDIDHKFNPTTKQCEIPYRSNTMRRMWSYFADHAHKYIICNFGNINNSENKTTAIVPTIKTTTSSITTTGNENIADNTTDTNNDFDDSVYNSFAAPVFCKYLRFYTICVGILVYCFTCFI